MPAPAFAGNRRNDRARSPPDRERTSGTRRSPGYSAAQTRTPAADGRRPGLSVFDRQLGVADHLLPPLATAADIFGELLRRTRHRFIEVGRQESVAKAAVRENVLDRGVDLDDDLPWRAVRREQVEPDERGEARQGFGHGRQLRKLSQALAAA